MYSALIFALIGEANYRMAASFVQIVTCLYLVAQIKCKLVNVLMIKNLRFIHDIQLAAQSFDCPQTGNANGLPTFQSYLGADEITRHHQAIIPSYQLVCSQPCGVITEWGVDLQPAGGMHNMWYTIDFQVWRPSPIVDDSTGTGCYSLVGNNRFTSIPLSDGVARVIPSPQDYIQFQPGDVLGFYVEEARRATDGVVVFTEPSSFTSELVWYASIAPTMATSQNGDCPYSVGSNGALNTIIRQHLSSQYQQVRIQKLKCPIPLSMYTYTATYPCPSLPTMATTQPAPQPPNPTMRTTDSEETPPTTSQQTQEPADHIFSFA